EVEHGDVVVERLQVALAIPLEAVAVDHDGRRRLAVPARLLLRLVVRVLVADDEGDARAVGRPLDVGHAALDLAHLLRLAAAPVEQPDLAALLLLLLGPSRGDEREPGAVRAPPGRGLAVRRRGE